MDEETLSLAKTLIDEMVSAAGLPRIPLFQGLFWLLFRGVTTRFAGLGVTFDRITRDEGLPRACSWGLSHFGVQITARGGEHIPATGPLLVVANHPGAFDAFLVFSQLVRKDIHWISTEIPFLRSLPNVCPHVIFASRTDTRSRITALRSAIRHLKDGGTLLYFGAGHRDPDPSVYPGATEQMDAWLPGIDVFCRHVPGLRMLPTVVSGVVSPSWAHHPITWLRRKPIDSRRLAEFGQVISLMLRPGGQMLDSAISFGPPMTAAALQAESSGQDVLPAVIALEKALLAEHLQWRRAEPSPAAKT
jgi:1-acyl-sn-glycerol-3-phosphate acyltransferase